MTYTLLFISPKTVVKIGVKAVDFVPIVGPTVK